MKRQKGINAGAWFYGSSFHNSAMRSTAPPAPADIAKSEAMVERARAAAAAPIARPAAPAPLALRGVPTHFDGGDIDGEGRWRGELAGCLECHETEHMHYGVTDVYLLAALQCGACGERFAEFWT